MSSIIIASGYTGFIGLPGVSGVYTQKYMDIFEEHGETLGALHYYEPKAAQSAAIPDSPNYDAAVTYYTTNGYVMKGFIEIGTASPGNPASEKNDVSALGASNLRLMSKDSGGGKLYMHPGFNNRWQEVIITLTGSITYMDVAGIDAYMNTVWLLDYQGRMYHVVSPQAVFFKGEVIYWEATLRQVTWDYDGFSLVYGTIRQGFQHLPLGGYQWPTFGIDYT